MKKYFREKINIYIMKANKATTSTTGSLLLLVFLVFFSVIIGVFMFNPIEDIEQPKGTVEFEKEGNQLYIYPEVIGDEPLQIYSDGSKVGTLDENSDTVIISSNNNIAKDIKVYSGNELLQTLRFDPDSYGLLEVVNLQTHNEDKARYIKYDSQIKNTDESTIPKNAEVQFKVEGETINTIKTTRELQPGETYNISGNFNNVPVGIKNVTAEILNPGEDPVTGESRTYKMSDKVRVYRPTTFVIDSMNPQSDQGVSKPSNINYDIRIKNIGAPGDGDLKFKVSNVEGSPEIWFIIDNSGSMRQPIDAVIHESVNFVGQVKNDFPETKFGVVDIKAGTRYQQYNQSYYQNRDYNPVGMVHGLSSDARYVEQVLRNIQVGGGSEPMYGGIANIAENHVSDNTSKVAIIISNENDRSWYNNNAMDGVGANHMYQVINDKHIRTVCICSNGTKESSEYYSDYYDSESETFEFKHDSAYIQEKLTNEVLDNIKEEFKRPNENENKYLDYNETESYTYTINTNNFNVGAYDIISETGSDSVSRKLNIFED